MRVRGSVGRGGQTDGCFEMFEIFAQEADLPRYLPVSLSRLQGSGESSSR